MGFTAFLDGAILDAFDASKAELQAARELDRRRPGTLLTPCCGQRAQVRLPRSRQKHFAHWPGVPRTTVECERWENKSKEHRDLQRIIYEAAVA